MSKNECALLKTMKVILVVLITLGYINRCRAQKCTSPNITESQFEYGYDFEKELSLKFFGIFEKFQMTGTERIYSTSNNNWPTNYIDARYASGNLEVYTTSNFRRYVEEQSSSRINLQVILVCEDQSRPILMFRINIKKENIYEPTFSNPLYNFSVPLPLYKGFDLTRFQEISARDVDIFDNKVIFTSNNSGIVAVTTNPEADFDGKTFYARLELTAPILTLLTPLEFTITATDSGQPPKSAIARVRISANQTASIPPQPNFQKPIYQGKLSDSLNSLVLEDMILVPGTWSTSVKFRMEGEDANHFVLGSTGNRLRVRLNKTLSEDDVKDKSYFSFVIIASQLDVPDGICTVVIGITKKVVEHRFSRSYYTGRLDKWGNISTENIIYNPDDSVNVTFRLTGLDANLFNLSNNQNRIAINFVGNIQTIDFEQRRYLLVMIGAVRQNREIANAAISISLPIVPRFLQTLYSGRIEKNGTLALTNVQLDAAVMSSIKAVSVTGEHSKRFVVRGSNSGIRLILNNPFTSKEIHTMKVVQLRIIATTRADIEGSTNVLIEFPNFLEPPQFEQAMYKGSVNKEGELTLDDIVLVNTTFTNGTVFQLQGDTADYFELNSTKNIIILKLKRRIPNFMLQSENYLILIIVAQNEEDVTASTSILLDVPIFIAPTFTKIIYKGMLDRYYQLNLEDITIAANTDEEELEIILSGDDSKFFKAKLNTMNVVLSLNDSFNPDEIQQKSSLDLFIVVKNKDGLSGRTAVVVEIPAICSEGVGTCPPCVLSSAKPCPEITTPDPKFAPTFDRRLYLFRIDPNTMGEVGIVSAKISGFNATVLYSLEINNVHLKSRMSINGTSGQVNVHEYISPGLYSFQVIARNSITNALGNAVIRLTVDAANQCPNGTNVVSSALLVKNIAEEEVHTNLLNAKYGRCVFTIFSIEPDDKDYVKIDQRTNQLNTIAIDREAEIFSNMILPQVLVKLKLNCPGMEDVSRRQRRSLSDKYTSENDSRSLILIDDLPFDPYLTAISLIIDDINDHSPEFVNPPRSDFVIGYPELDVYYDLMPEYLIRVEAIDRDSGINAKIRYSLDENRYFEIDTETGVIYPLASSGDFTDDFELVVTACDRDGAYDGKRTSVKLLVKTLMANHLTLLTISDGITQSVDGILRNISVETGYNVYDLRHAMMPNRGGGSGGIEARSTGRKAVYKKTLNVWVYAVDKDGRFVEGVGVEEELNQFHDKYELETAPYVSERRNKFAIDPTGLVTGISILGALLLALCAGAAVLWWFWIRPYAINSVLNETVSETVSSDGSVDNEMKHKTAKNFYYEDGFNYDAGQQYKSRAIAEATNPDLSDESNTNSLERYDGESDLSDDAQNERRKSIVTFNELVERIDIDTASDNFRHNNNNNDNNVRL